MNKSIKTLDKFTVKRKTWDRGKEYSFLYNSETKKKCVMGFLGIRLGMKLEDLAEVMYLEGNKLLRVPKLTWNIMRDIAKVNDQSIKDPDDLKLDNYEKPVKIKSESARELWLTRLFKKAGIEVEFVD